MQNNDLINCDFPSPCHDNEGNVIVSANKSEWMDKAADRYVWCLMHTGWTRWNTALPPSGTQWENNVLSRSSYRVVLVGVRLLLPQEVHNKCDIVLKKSENQHFCLASSTGVRCDPFHVWFCPAPTGSGRESTLREYRKFPVRTQWSPLNVGMYQGTPSVLTKMFVPLLLRPKLFIQEVTFTIQRNVLIPLLP